MAKLTPEAITQEADVKPIDLWERPTPFEADQLPAFPAEALPSWLAEYVTALAHATQTPPDLAGLLVLAALATALAKKVRVAVRQGYSEPVNLFTVIAMPPGSRKSPVFEVVMHPIQSYEEACMRKMADEIARAEVHYNIAQAELQHLQAKAAKETNSVEQMRLDEEAATLAVKLLGMLPPEKPRLVTDDTTPEAARVVVGRKPRMHGGPQRRRWRRLRRDEWPLYGTPGQARSPRGEFCAVS